MTTPLDAWEHLDAPGGIASYQHHDTHLVCILDTATGYQVGYGTNKLEALRAATDQLVSIAHSVPVTFSSNAVDELQPWLPPSTPPPGICLHIIKDGEHTGTGDKR